MGCSGGTGECSPVCRKEGVHQRYAHAVQQVHRGAATGPSTSASVLMDGAVDGSAHCRWGCGMVEVMLTAGRAPCWLRWPRRSPAERVRHLYLSGQSPAPWTTLPWLFCSGATSSGQHAV